MNKKIECAVIQTLVNGYNISFYLQEGTLSAFQVNRHPGTSHTISILHIPSHIGDIPVTSIADFGFVETDTLLLITIPETVTSIGERAFTGCMKLADISIPGSIKTVPFSFQSCENLKMVTFNEGVERIEQGAFSDCENIEVIQFPSSLIYISDDAFKESKNIEIINTNGNEEAIRFAKKRNIKYY